jgi:hypothetical protein
MQWLKRLLGKPDVTAAPSAAADSEISFSRASPDSPPAAPGQQRATFLAEVAVVLGPDNPIDLNKSLQNDYGCADLDVSECVQCAEEVWGVQLLPNPMAVPDYEAMMRRFPTLESIAREAELAAAKRP